jgi:hypothetical protein
MPFHAFLSVWLGHLIGYQTIWQGWKEVVIALITGAALILASRQPNLRRRLHQPLIYIIMGFAAIALLITLLTQPSLQAALIGIKTDLEFLVLFVVAYLVATRSLKLQLVRWFLTSCGVVIGFGLLQIFVLPHDVLRHFGYGPDTIQPFLQLDPALDTVRILSTLGGPNQLGSFLILPLCLVVALMLSRFRLWHLPYLVGGLLVLGQTHSRSAWLGLAVGVMMTMLFSLPRRWRIWFALGSVIVAAAGLQLLINLSGQGGDLQYYLFHGSLQHTGIMTSTDLHSRALQDGWQEIMNHPLGQGLGTAGPASFYGPQPFIPESYYLQVGVEAGIIGVLSFLLIELALMRQLIQQARTSVLPVAVLGALCGMMVVNVFLHGWSDSSTALTFWLLAGVALVKTDQTT